MCCGVPGLAKGNSEQSKEGECAVCVGINNDHTHKTVYYCYACSEWICKSCETSWMNRGLAAVKKLFRF